MICQLDSQHAQHCHGEDDQSATFIIPPATRNYEFLRLSCLEGLDGLDWVDGVRSGWVTIFF